MNVDFNYNHLINIEHRVDILLALVFRYMMVHGHKLRDILASTIIYFFNAICRVFDSVFVNHPYKMVRMSLGK